MEYSISPDNFRRKKLFSQILCLGKWKFKVDFWASSHSTMVEQFIHHLNDKGLSPAKAAGTKRENPYKEIVF